MDLGKIIGRLKRPGKIGQDKSDKKNQAHNLGEYLPAENFAIKSGVHPRVSIAENINYIRKQLKEMGAMFAWSKELATSDPRYYKWTQWLFLKFFEKGMAVRRMAPVNWCPSCNTVLANEQVVDGLCERCETEIVRKNLKPRLCACKY